jgi:hypothetical protein
LRELHIRGVSEKPYLLLVAIRICVLLVWPHQCKMAPAISQWRVIADPMISQFEMEIRVNCEHGHMNPSGKQHDKIYVQMEYHRNSLEFGRCSLPVVW